jgi:hypothetical protein
MVEIDDRDWKKWVQSFRHDAVTRKIGDKNKKIRKYLDDLLDKLRHVGIGSLTAPFCRFFLTLWV